jgi:hypothetical protein
MRFTAAIALAAVAALSGCAENVYLKNPAELQALTTERLCVSYHARPSEGVRAELTARNVIRAQSWVDIDKKEVRIGMTETELVCAWGRAVRVNNTTTAHSVRNQHVYGVNSRSYVYTVDGIVTSWQH